MAVSAWFQCICIVRAPPSACDRLQFSGARRAPAADERWEKLAGIKPCNVKHEVYTDSLLCRRRESYALHRGPSDLGATCPARQGWPQESAVGATGHSAHHHHAIQQADPESGDRSAQYATGAADPSPTQARPAHVAGVSCLRSPPVSVLSLALAAGISYDLASGRLPAAG